MGRKDMVDRPYFSDRERFAELMNAVLYRGEKVILPGNLRLQKRKYPSLRGRSGEIERDVLMEDISHHICYGLEIETEYDYGMPERVFAYDACEYEYQLARIDRGHRDRKEYTNYREWKSRMKESDFLFSAVTVVLFLGEGHWMGKRKLSQMCRMSVKIRNLLGENFCDYGFPLVEADYVETDVYKTDLKEFFQAMQCRRDKSKLKRLFQTENFRNINTETALVIARHLHVTGLIHKMEKEELPMCVAFDELMKEERQKGLREGKREGKKEGEHRQKLRIIKRMKKEGFDEAVIVRITDCTKKELAAAIRR